MVETSTLSSVPPPDITYSLSLPRSVADKGSLSALQLEAIIYACQVRGSTLPACMSYTTRKLPFAWTDVQVCFKITRNIGDETLEALAYRILNAF